jgi:hypothetical protein
LLAAASIVLTFMKAWWLGVRVFRAPASAPATTLVAPGLSRPCGRPDDGASWTGLFEVADRNVRQAKKGGRNRTIGRDRIGGT